MPSIMGEFRTGRFWTIGGPLVSLLVVGINMFFTYQIIAGYDSIPAYVVVGIIAVFYIGKNIDLTEALLNYVFSICNISLLFILGRSPSSEHQRLILSQKRRPRTIDK